MLSFKNWIYNELAGKNAYNRMVVQHPAYQGMPTPVRKEFINSAFGSTVNSTRSSVGNHKPMLPSEFLNNSDYRNRDWSKPHWIIVTPLSFNERTLDTLIQRCFGFRPIPDIRNDLNRTMTQKGLMGADMEAVILFQEGNKYNLKEGWHRTMNVLLNGAPQQEINLLQAYAKRLSEIDQLFLNQGQLVKDNRTNWLLTCEPIVNELKKHLNLQSWGPMRLKAYIGSQKPNIARPATNPIYVAGTAEYNPYITSAA